MISVIDTERFGIQIAKTELNSLAELSHFERFADENNVRLAIGRAAANNLAVVQEAMRRGFILMDTLVYFAYVYSEEEITNERTEGGLEIRLAEPRDAEEVKRVAAEAFRGYQSHYHADQRLAPESCDAVYADWAFRSCLSRQVADAVLLYEDHSGIGGFGTLKYSNETGVVQGPLFGVHSRTQGRGVFRSLLKEAKRWGSSRRAREFYYSTQITNLIVQKTLCREGFVPVQYEYTLHKWFD